MRQILKTFLFFSLLTICYLLLTPTASEASGEFSISYDNLYQVDENGNFNVTQNVKITNLTTQFYAQEMEISVGNVKIQNLQAFDKAGLIPVTSTFEDSKTKIRLKFTNPLVGKGKIRDFTLNYTANELINKTDQILEVSIPKLADSTDIGEYNVTLEIPSSFGPVAYMTPQPQRAETVKTFGDIDKYFFDKNQLTQSGVSAAFGKQQIYSFTLTYHLQNAKSAKTEIAIPADNSYQKIIIEKIEPEPKDVRLDSDGNWLALYQLSGGKPVDVKVSGFAQVYPKPRFKMEKPDNFEQYLKPQQYWEVDDDYFTQKAKQFTTPKQIYDFVVSFLSYNEKRLTLPNIERKGAKTIVSNPTDAVCMEFTDLFITMARAAKIPAREINGFAQSSNLRLKPLSLSNFGQDVLHAWPEYWDESTQTWIQIDPTWGFTTGGLDYFSKMDFAHIAFVHKGLSSTYPIPAGGYKTNPAQSGDVKVEVAKSLPAPTFNPKITIKLGKNLLSGVGVTGKILVKNLSNQAISGNPLKIKTKNLVLKTSNEVNLGILPPNAVREVEFEVQSPGLLTKKTGEVLVSLGPESEVINVQIRPLLVIVIVGFLAGSVFIVGLLFGSFFLIKRKF